MSTSASTDVLSPDVKGKGSRSEMPKLLIDGQEIEVPVGTTVIEAAEKLGIMIPRFCYHPALGAVGACRMCAVMFKEGPVKGIEMSCMTEAQDGMVVLTDHPEAVDFRRHVVEWLMVNHPHDCPVCDEGGHCLLQDETISGGHGRRRYPGRKRTYRDQDLGPFIQHEMNRCIHCWRCRRFYQEYCGYRDLGAMQIGNRTYFGRYRDGALESPFAGNLIDICPTGVYTDKPARFKGRRWDFERAPSLCLHCSLGCGTTASARYREVIRQEARLSREVNGWFICDRGRFGFGYADHPARPRQPRAGGKPVPWQTALDAAVDGLKRASAARPGAVACVGSARNSFETMGALLNMCRNLGWRGPDFFWQPASATKARDAVAGIGGGAAVSMREIETADFVLAVGADPLNEAPMLALAMRQARRAGAEVAVLDPRPISLPFPFAHIAVGPEGLEGALGLVARAALRVAGVQALEAGWQEIYENLAGARGMDDRTKARLVRLGEVLAAARRPVLVCGTDIVRPSTPGWVGDCVRLLRASGLPAGLFCLLPGPNAFGAAIFAGCSEGGGDILTAIEEGTVKALLLAESDPFHGFPDRRRLKAALTRLDLLVVLDYLPSPAVEMADVFLPTRTVFEKGDVSFVNQEGRRQWVSIVHGGGTPFSQGSPGTHPPRSFGATVPGGEPEGAEQTLSALCALLNASEAEDIGEGLWPWLCREYPPFRDLPPPPEQRRGARLIPSGLPRGKGPSPTGPSTGPNVGQALELVLVDWTFGTEELSGYSSIIDPAEPEPKLCIYPGDAGRLGLQSGERVRLHLAGGPLEVALETAEPMAEGVLVLPRHRRLGWQITGEGPVLVPFHDIERL